MTIQHSPIAVEAIIAVVKAATAIVMPVWNSKHAIHGAHGTADASSDRAANQTADRTGCAVTFRSSLAGAAHDALRMAGMGDGKQGERERRCRQIELCG